MENKIKVSEAAKKLGLSSRALIRQLSGLGIKVKGYNSFFPEEIFKKIKGDLEEEKDQIKKKEVVKTEVQEEKKEVEKKAVQQKKKKKKRGRREIKLDEKKVEKGVKETLAKMKRKKKKKYKKTSTVEKEEGTIEIDEKKASSDKEKKVKLVPFMNIAELSQKMNVSDNDLIKACLDLGILANRNKRLDKDTIQIIADHFGFSVSWEDDLKILEEEEKEKEGNVQLKSRPPVVVVMGHVDHGKTTLLDYIRRTKVAAKEAGKITQHIGAYRAKIKDFLIVFLDTPGHEAYTSMRVRGAQIADVAILVIAADDGVMPQTVEAFNHAKAANLPIIVAITKVDAKNANPDRVKAQLTEYGIVIEEYGGDTMAVEVSAYTGQGIDDLLDAVQIKSMELDLKAAYKLRARGFVIEAETKHGKGNVATIILQRGVLRKGVPYVCGEFAGKVRDIVDEHGKRLKELTPGMPGMIIGLPGIPEPGETFEEMKTEKKAREIASRRMEMKRERMLFKKKGTTLEEMQAEIEKGKIRELRIIVKGDTFGTAEALAKSLKDSSLEEVTVNVVHFGVGNITKTDVDLAYASGSVIIGFHVNILPEAKSLAEKQGIQIRMYDVIYNAIEDVRFAMLGMLEPEIHKEYIGTVQVRQIFTASKIGKIAGCYVKDGYIERGASAVVKRGEEVLAETEIISLKRFSKDVKKVETGYECGLVLNGFDDFEVGDEIECSIEVEVKKDKREDK